MDASRFDRLTRTLVGMRSRRHLLAALLAGLTGSISGNSPTRAGSGCKNVGRKCQRAKECCSGICKGKKGKKRCKGHDSQGCQPKQGGGVCVGMPVACNTSGGATGSCVTTTGNAGYCAAAGLSECTACKRDADCRTVCGKRAACGHCPNLCGYTGGTICFGPEPNSCTFP